MSERIPAEELEAAWLRAAHRLMACLHIAKAESGVSFAEMVARIDMDVAQVQRHFWDPECYRGMKATTDLAYAMGREVEFQLPRRLALAPLPEPPLATDTVQHASS